MARCRRGRASWRERLAWDEKRMELRAAAERARCKREADERRAFTKMLRVVANPGECPKCGRRAVVDVDGDSFTAVCPVDGETWGGSADLLSR